MNNNQQTSILWVDDEIESLQSQILFLQGKGYQIATTTNGFDALEFVKNNIVDIVLLDESMPGISGLETLRQIKEYDATIKIVMITKNEAENIMDEAIGSQITDYLIKPVNPNQVLLSIKKIVDNKRLVAETTTQQYQQQFNSLFATLNNYLDYKEWMDVYKKLVFWELELKNSQSPEMAEVFQTQKAEANNNFYKYISKNYENWMQQRIQKNTSEVDAPLMSHTLLQNKLLPVLQEGGTTFLVLIDNLRYDQWKTIQPFFAEYYRINEEDTFFSILPTATQYARNALFAGMLPAQIQKTYPNEWVYDDDETGKNLNEEYFLKKFLERNGFGHIKTSFTKITSNNDAQKFADNVSNLLSNNLNVVVYNFVDMLSHVRTEMEVLKELAADETAYRSITKSWFEHSPLYQALQKIADKNIQLILTTDHGSSRVKNPTRVVGDKQTTTNLRYKHGKNLNYDPKDVLAFKNPEKAGLPVPNINSSYIFAKPEAFLCYPNNYNYYAQYYKNSFQHGGISLEEMIIPVITMGSK